MEQVETKNAKIESTMLGYEDRGLIGRPGIVYGWAGSWCPGHLEDKPIVFGSGFCPPIAQPECNHCYCKRINIEWGNTEKPNHKQCCNCGNKQKLSGLDNELNKLQA